METIYIYALDDPRTNEVRYIGRTSAPERRLSQHMSEKKNQRKRQWIDELKGHGLRPIMRILETVDTQEKGEWAESEYIAQYNKAGADLFNIRDICPGENMLGRTFLKSGTIIFVIYLWHGKQRHTRILEFSDSDIIKEPKSHHVYMLDFPENLGIFEGEVDIDVAQRTIPTFWITIKNARFVDTSTSKLVCQDTQKTNTMAPFSKTNKHFYR